MGDLEGEVTGLDYPAQLQEGLTLRNNGSIVDFNFFFH